MLNKNILYLSYDGMTDPLGQSQVLPYLLGLVKKGYNISLISFEKKKRFGEGRNQIAQFCLKGGIEWYPEIYTKRPPVLSTVMDLFRMRNKALKLHRDKKFILVHCRSYIPALVGQYLKKKFVLPFVFDMRGFWADERVDGNLWNLNNPMYRIIYNFFKKKEKQFLEEADSIVCLTGHSKSELESWRLKRELLPISVIPCCVDLDLFHLEKISDVDISKLKKLIAIGEGIKIFSYIGSIGTWYMLKEMLSFFKQWLAKNPESVFLFVTLESPATILSHVKDLKIDEDKIRVVRANRQEMPVYVKLSDYSLFFIRPLYSKKASSPTKQAEIMAMGVPIICNTGIGDTDQIVKKYNAGILIDEISERGYEKAIKELDGAEWNTIDIVKGAKETYSLEAGIEKYAMIYEKLLCEK